MRLSMVVLLLSLLSTPGLAKGRGESLRPLELESSVKSPELLRPVYFSVLKNKAKKIEDRNSLEGWGYILSGAVALGISIPGYYLSDDVFARSVYSISETLGVGAIGYGTYLTSVSDDYVRFVRMLESTPGLSFYEKEKLSYEFLKENALRARSIRKIRVISHALTAGLNFLNGATTSSRELKTALYFIGGINILATASFLFGESEEEEFFDQIRSSPRATVSLHAGETRILAGWQFRF